MDCNCELNSLGSAQIIFNALLLLNTYKFLSLHINVVPFLSSFMYAGNSFAGNEIFSGFFCCHVKYLSSFCDNFLSKAVI